MPDSRDLQMILSGANAEFLEELYRDYQANPENFDGSWAEFFTDLPVESENGGSQHAAPRFIATMDELPPEAESLGKQSKVFQLINNYRVFGHTRAKLDPLGRPHMDAPPDLSLQYFGLSEDDLGQSFSTGTLVGEPMAKLSDIYEQLVQTYCGSVGAEYMPIRDHEQRRWLQVAMESVSNKPVYDRETRWNILEKLTHAELLEKFLHTKFVGQKRFSLEGAETLIVMLDAIVEEGAMLGAEEVVLGMPHRGRLNALVNVMRKKHEFLFAEFSDAWHKQDRRGDTARERIMPVLIHGDAAVIGQGLVVETLNLSRLTGYATGGTIHIICNNQIGFTTSPRFYKSTLYSSDVCKLLNIPVLHVNGDDPEAAYHVMKLAMQFRQKFHTDIMVDLMCYRRHGHNEMDEPSFTQPLTYKLIKTHPSTLTLYTQQLESEGVFTDQEMESIQKEYRTQMDEALTLTTQGEVVSRTETLSGAWSGLERTQPDFIEITEVNRDVLQSLAHALTNYPEGFTPHPRVAKLLETRAEMGAGKVALDWGMGELLAYGSLLWEGFDVRLSGQDVTRGTFSHRHANLVDVNNGTDYVPLQHVKEGQGVFTAIDGPLSEAGVLGFEFGYSLADPYSLVIWEAQFGDFANGAQVIIDQFITSSEEKWLRLSGLVLLLPHGFEGQGPEHSSARLERFLQACGRRNIQVCNATTPAQLFHLLRRQLHRNFRKPLVVMSPKSLLRHPMAVSSIDDLIKGSFRRILFEQEQLAPKGVTRVALCSGKVYYDLLAARQKAKVKHVALIRLEQFYPFPDDQLVEVMAKYPQAKDVVWVQEEPQNMGGWWFVRPYLEEHLPAGLVPRYIGRTRAASPATGSHKTHDAEQAALVDKALAK